MTAIHLIEKAQVRHSRAILKTEREGYAKIPRLELIHHFTTDACYILFAILNVLPDRRSKLRLASSTDTLQSKAAFELQTARTNPLSDRYCIIT